MSLAKWYTRQQQPKSIISYQLSKLALPKDPFRLLSVGDVRKMKNYPTLVRAVESVNEGLSQDITLTILVRRPSAAAVCVEIIYFDTGAGFRIRLCNVLRSFERLHPAVHGDGFGVAALEGMLAGLPTIVTELVGMKQLLDDRWVFDPTNEWTQDWNKNMIEIPQDDRIQLGLQNRHRSQSFSPESQAQSFRDAVTSI